VVWLPHPKAEVDGEIQVNTAGFGFKSSYTQEIMRLAISGRITIWIFLV
jgi:hypothetical protein